MRSQGGPSRLGSLGEGEETAEMQARRDAWAQRKDAVREDSVCTPRRQASGDTRPADTLILGFQPLEL